MTDVYQPGDVALYPRTSSHVLVVAELIADVYLAVTINPAENPGKPDTSTGLYYVEDVDGYIVPTLVRAYRAPELAGRVAHVGNDPAFDLTRALYIAALGGKPA
jgi:hypothetical protein